MIPEADDPPPDEADPFESLEADDSSDVAAPAGTLLGALGQIAAAALVVLAVVALFIGGAVAVRWISR
jgi:hypothetical protein